MSPVELQDFDMPNVDMAYAVSQSNLNNGLDVYLTTMTNQEISWGFDYGDEGQPVPPKDPSNPNVQFSGTISSPAPTKWILDLSNPVAANQVAFNLAFTGAMFTINTTNQTIAQTSPLWFTPFTANLTQVLGLPADLPPDALPITLSQLVSAYGQVFDLNQVLIDLGQLQAGADLASDKPPEFSCASEWAFLVEAMAVYLSSNAPTIFQGLQPASSTATSNGNTPNTPLPSCTPTAAQFVIVPNTAAPGLSALVWALMVNNNPIPATPADDFSNVEFFSDDSVAGVAILASRNFLPFLLSEFSPINQATLSIVAVSTGSVAAWGAGPAPSPPPPFTSITPSTATPTFGTLQMNGMRTTAEAPFALSSATTSLNLSLAFGMNAVTSFYNQIKLSGQLFYTAGFGTYGLGGSDFQGWDSPRFAYAWNQVFDIAADGDTGGVAFSTSSSGFTFNTAGQTGSWSGGFPSIQQSLVNELHSDALSSLQSQLKSGFTAIAHVGDFVFPGAGTFSFQQAGVTQAWALYINLGYEAP